MTRKKVKRKHKIINGLKQAIEFKAVIPSFDLRIENAVNAFEAAIEDTINRLKGNTEQDIIK